MSENPSLRATRHLRVLWIAILLGLPGAALAGDPARFSDPDHDRAYRVLDEAKSKAAGNVRAQADALIAHAWPAGGATDPLVAAMAREQLTQFGADGVQALRQAISRVERHYQFDVVATLIETKARMSGGLPSDYLPAVEDAIWFGSLEARRLAIPEAARQSYPMAVLSTIDAAYEDPTLLPVVAQALGDHRNPRARRFLKEVMQTGHPQERLLAARALGRISGRGMATLRDAARDDDPGCRTAALLTLLPVTSTADLSLLHEYIGLHPDENPELHRMVMQRAVLLESIQEKQMEADAASAD